MYREEEYAMGPIRKFATKACKNAKPGSPLAMLMQRRSHNSSILKGHLGSGNTKNISKNVLDEAITLLFAGQDTSAATLSWTLHLLSLYPQKQKKLADEIQKYMMLQRKSSSSADHGTNFELEANSMTKKLTSQMPYLDAVIKESMRLYPVAPFVVRKLNEDIEIPESCSFLPKNSFACIWIYGLHRNPSLWTNPDNFSPERWLNNIIGDAHDEGKLEFPASQQSSTTATRNQIDKGILEGAFMPFATGPRNCLGQSLGNVVLRIFLARIITSYEIVDLRLDKWRKKHQARSENNLDTDQKINISMRKDMQAGFTVLPLGGVCVALRKRHR